jgi:quercetin dioxygenase-like cupin family protein
MQSETEPTLHHVHNLPHALRVHREARGGKVLETIEAAKGTVMPHVVHPSAEEGRVLRGRIRFMQNGTVRDMVAGDTWTVSANEAQGPHIVLDDGTAVAILRHGSSAFDLV